MGDTAAAAEDEHAATTAAAIANPSANASDDLLMTNLATATRVAIEASFVALGAWGKVVLLLSQAASRGAVVAYPTVRRLTIKAATAFAAQPRNAIAAEVGALVVLLLQQLRHAHDLVLSLEEFGELMDNALVALALSLVFPAHKADQMLGLLAFRLPGLLRSALGHHR